jgi:hypothetical protein
MNQEIPPKDTGSNAPREIPGRGYYFLGGTLIGGGIIGFTALLVWGLLASNQTDIRVLAPGVETIEFPEPGEYTIFHEYSSTYRGTRTLAGKSLPEMNITLLPEASAKNITPYRIGSDLTYTARGRKGVSAFRFRVHEPGAYRLRTEFSEPDEAGTRVLAVKYWNLSRIPAVVARSWLAFLLPTAIGLFIMTYTAAKRRPPKPSPFLPLSKYFR